MLWRCNECVACCFFGDANAPSSTLRHISVLKSPSQLEWLFFNNTAVALRYPPPLFQSHSKTVNKEATDTPKNKAVEYQDAVHSDQEGDHNQPLSSPNTCRLPRVSWGRAHWVRRNRGALSPDNIYRPTYRPAYIASGIYACSCLEGRCWWLEGFLGQQRHLW